MTKKIFRSILAVAVAVLLLCIVVITGVIYNHLSSVQRKQLETELYLTAEAVQISGKDYLTKLDTEGYRITWVDSDGTVLFDTRVDINEMGNHKDREEIAEALETGKGESVRRSDTLTEKRTYYAVLLDDGTVLRISDIQDSIWALIRDVMLPLVVILCVAVILSSILAKHMANAIVNPFNELNLDEPLKNDTYEELSPLLTRISKLHKKIEEQVLVLKEKTDEFDQVVDAMNEGLVLVDKKGNVLSINKEARRIFGVDGDLIGESYLKVGRSIQYTKSMENALQGGHNQFSARKKGREYQCDVSCIQSDDKVIGAVLLIFDVTEMVNAQKSRQEFTANVSHELKTPLQSIIGSAELLENGLVKPEDTSRFIGHIKTEATRLVELINDIMRLSQLDENTEAASEEIDLYTIAKEVIDVLRVSALNKNVTFVLEGSSCIMTGVKSYIYEVIYNLCDNAVRYNVEGGRVYVNIETVAGNKVITVSDTGIGIEAEHHSRIFERFYRVDKSHSKQTGGTGLGLSIVKHAVMHHGGTLKLESEPGKGTTIKVVF